MLTNNQIGRYISRENATILKNVFSATANGFGRVFYQPNEFTVLQDSFAFSFINKAINPKNVSHFVIATLNKVFSNYNWQNKSGWNKIKDDFVELPIKNGQIDYETMEKISKGIEIQYLLKVQKYLTKKTQKNTSLLEIEREREIASFIPFKISDLFTSENGDFDIQKKHINDHGEYVITSGLANNGVLGKSDINAKVFNENTYTIDMFGNAFYRSFKYKLVTHARVFALFPKFRSNEKIGSFIATSFKKFSKVFGYSNMCSWSKVKKEVIFLPSKNGELDLKYIEHFIYSIEEKIIEKISNFIDGKISDLNKN
ncbi:restriction endonuclease subunit S [Mycoplasma sp. Ms02]|nr:restriction endonuclease subunit S [Mycoplasma sp. Ms02]